LTIQFIGLGYIGLPTAVIVAQQGVRVLGVDVNPVVVDAINNGQAHIFEPGLETVLKDTVSKGTFTASTTAAPADIHLVVVPTPFKSNLDPDISFVEAATRSLIPILKHGDIYILESTSPIGTTEKMAELIFSLRPELKDKISIAYCPERVLPGNILYELVNNDRVIGGIDDHSTEQVVNFYKTFVKGDLHKTNCRTAEMCKLTENSSRDVQIAFANELSLICDKAGIDVWELINLANKHPRVNILQPGSGVGGHCIAVDPYFIVSAYPNESKLISTAREINNYKAFWCAEKVENARLQFKLTHGRDPIIAMMGLAFKPNIDDLREAPAKFITQKVMQSISDGILVVEPNIQEHGVFKLTEYREAYQRADIVAYLVAHDEFKTLPSGEDKVILDFCGVFKK
jgi:UDP-N-acetyl-D-mannosaminuronic acid dehydrogenase